MNIFVLNKDPKVCAEQHCDKHVVKMILEYAQLLSTAHHELDGELAPEGIYKSTHRNHPSAIWARKSNNNYTWLYCLFCELCKEYTHRYGKIHKTEALKNVLRNLPKNIEVGYLTPQPICMPDEYKVDSITESYHNYYVGDKARFAKWTNRDVPEWFIKGR